MGTYEAKLSSMESMKESAVEECESSVARSLHGEVSSLRARRSAAAAALREHNERVRRAAERTAAVFTTIDEIEAWLLQVNRTSPYIRSPLHVRTHVVFIKTEVFSCAALFYTFTSILIKSKI